MAKYNLELWKDNVQFHLTNFEIAYKAKHKEHPTAYPLTQTTEDWNREFQAYLRWPK